MRRDRPHRPAMGDGLVHAEVEPVIAPVGLGPIERALPARGGEPSARGALPGLVVCAFLVEQDSTRASEAASSVSAQPDAARPPRPAPSRQRSSSEASWRARADSRIGLVRSSSSRGEACASALVQPTIALFVWLETSSSNSARTSSDETTITFGACMLRTRRSSSSATSFRCSATSFWCGAGIGLRPAALVVAAGNVVGAVHDLFQPSRVEAEQLSALTADEGDERSLAAADERNERREVELPANPDAIGHRLDQGARPPDVVHSGREDCDAVRPVALELVGEVVPDPREVLLERDPLVMREPSVVRLGMALALREQRAHPGRSVAGGRSRLRIEVEVEADRATLLRPELRELAEPVPAHRLGHVGSFPMRAAILRM